MRGIKLFLSGIVIFFICCGTVLAEGVESKTAEALPIQDPDLAVSSINFAPTPKEGRNIDLVKIGVMNRGRADAGKCVLGLSCVVIKCDEGNKCDEVSRSISAEISVPPLKQDEATVLEWRPASATQWAAGKYSFIANIDKYK